MWNYYPVFTLHYVALFNFLQTEGVPKEYLFTVRNEVAKVMFLQVCVCPEGRGWYPSMPCRWCRSMPCSRSPGECLLRRGYACSGGACSGGGACSQGDVFVEETPPPASRRLLLRTVRILLECILVFEFTRKGVFVNV